MIPLLVPEKVNLSYRVIIKEILNDKLIIFCVGAAEVSAWVSTLVSSDMEVYFLPLTENCVVGKQKNG